MVNQGERLQVPLTFQVIISIHVSTGVTHMHMELKEFI